MEKHKDKTRLSADCCNCTFYEEGYCSYFDRFQTEKKPHDTCEHFWPSEFADELMKFEQEEDDE